MEFDRDKILNDLKTENEFLIKLVNLIPAKMYFDKELQEKITSQKHSIMNSKMKSLKRSFSKQPDLSAKGKHKRARLDPQCHKSVSQVHEELSGKKHRKKKKGNTKPIDGATRAVDIKDLQERLHERIKAFETKRKSCAKDDPQRKRLKTKEKKMKHKKAALAEAAKQIKAIAKTVTKDSAPKPKYNKDGNVLYGKLDFSEDGQVETTKKKGGGKKYKKLLHVAEKQKERIETLREQDPKKASSVQEKERWKKAILKSENVKVKDNPDLLKKSIKRQEKIKKGKAKEWKERVEHTEARKKARIEKRNRNILKRKKDKLEHKIKHAKKRGRVITKV